MTKDEAIDVLIALAKGRIETINRAWGCEHSFEEALTNVSKEKSDWWGTPAGPLNCTMHDDAVQVATVARILGREI